MVQQSPLNPLGPASSICLCMIVKDEAAVIERCLASVCDLVHTWVISDTGSTDGTQALIRRAFDGIPGELHEEPWVNFGRNRTLNIEHARGKADYLLLIDADMVVRRDGALPALTADSYMLRHVADQECRIKRLVRGDMAWRYEGAIHEYLTRSLEVCDRLLAMPDLPKSYREQTFRNREFAVAR
ncbi:glycosyltransferase [Saccharothrix sp. ST-888]|uniref:glycosyltransferase n=1 Tax=Saccharothrix sp. ST-888 TaxID=1427391 RepID=UPI0006981CBF|nr:glycosyltransferase [Saccharothrix sp. ST-888]